MEKKLRPKDPTKGNPDFNIDPIIIDWYYEINYRHSYAQDSPFFEGLSKGKLMGSACIACPRKFATPRAHCMKCGAKTQWIPLPHVGNIHTFTTCYFGGESFLKETPFTLILVEFDRFDTLFLSRLVGDEFETVRIGLSVEAKFIKNSQYLVTDVYFIPTKNDGLPTH